MNDQKVIDLFGSISMLLEEYHDSEKEAGVLPEIILDGILLCLGSTLAYQMHNMTIDMSTINKDMEKLSGYVLAVIAKNRLSQGTPNETTH